MLLFTSSDFSLTSPICSKKSEATTLHSGLVASLSFLCCVLVGCSCCGLLLLFCVLFFAVGFSFLLVFSESQMSTQVPNGTNNWKLVQVEHCKVSCQWIKAL